MKVEVLASAHERPEHQFLTTFLVNDTVAVDAGCVGLYRDPRDQARITHIFLTHSHADHVLSLPMFVNNVYDVRDETIVVHGHTHVLESLKTDVFNDRVWPNFLKFSRNGSPVVRLDELTSERPVSVTGLTVTPVSISHPVPTFGYIVDDGASAVVFSSDSGPTDEIWKAAGKLPHLKAVFIGAAFPDAMHELAAVAGHLTPQLVKAELAKLPAHVSAVAIHVKPTHRSTVIEELHALGLPNLTIGECGTEYRF